MVLEPWYKVALPREEVREGRSFNPDEFAIALEQVVPGTAPTDYRDPGAFFARTCFTRALRDQTGMVLRLAGDGKHVAGDDPGHAVRGRQDHLVTAGAAVPTRSWAFIQNPARRRAASPPRVEGRAPAHGDGYSGSASRLILVSGYKQVTY